MSAFTTRCLILAILSIWYWWNNLFTLFP